MKSNIVKTTLVTLVVGLLSSGATAADPAATSNKAQVQESIYGSQLMTRAERIEHRNKMLSLKTPEEREAYRAEHHRQMQERAKARGLTLPEAPPPRSIGMGPGGPNQ